jgi:stage II sporulation protein D
VRKNQPVPKAWKKKKSSLKKQLMKSQQRKSNYSSGQTTQFQKIIPLKNRKTRYFNNREKRPWKLPTAIMLSLLLMLILAIPTTIVAFFGDSKKEDIASQETVAETEAAAEVESSPFSVSPVLLPLRCR